MAEFHRKIELQSLDDLQYLVNNIRRAADAEIEKNLPRMEDEMEDDMRVQVEKIIHEYIKTVLHTAAANITINGLSPDDNSADGASILQSILDNPAENSRSIEEHEPFNSKLFTKARELAAQEEELIEEIAKMRRDYPRMAVERRRNAWKETEGGDEEALQRLGEGDKGDGVVLAGLDRQSAVEGSWEKGVKGLEGMVRTLPETGAKVERARRAEGYVLGKVKR